MADSERPAVVDMSKDENSNNIAQNIGHVSAINSRVFVGINNHKSTSEEPEPHILNTSDYQSYKDINAIRVPNTCKWFLENSTYIRWRESDKNNLLWLTADPGCGKSVLSRVLVDEKGAGGESSTTCHFFFKDNDEQNSACQAMCALLHQLFCRKESLFCKYAISAVKANGPRLVTQFESLWRLFLAAATDPESGRITCVLDALDECKQDDRDKLIGKLQDFYLKSASQSNAGSSLKFLVTSRPYHQIELRFFQLTKNIPTVRLAGEEESKAISDEISLVVKARVAEIGEAKNLTENVKMSLERRLLDTSNRTYLWLRLIWDEIQDAVSTTEKKLLKVIEQLPETVEKAYEKLLMKCKKEEHARRVLHIILAAQRPLTLSELDVALEIQADSNSYEDLDLEGDKNRKTQIRTLCGLFVSIVDSKIYLIHQTAKEFFLRRSDEKLALTGWRHSFDLQKSHTILAQICITHLYFDEFKETPLTGPPSPISNLRNAWRHEPKRKRAQLRRFSNKHTLLDYSVEYWITHFREAGETADYGLISLASKLCDIGSIPFPIWFEIFCNSNQPSAYAQEFDRKGLQLVPHLHRDEENQSVALYWATLEGLEQVVIFLLKIGLNVNVQGGIYRTALQAAAAGGHEKIVQFLVESKADINAQGGKYGTALQAAAAGGYEEIVQFLVESKADVNIQSGEYGMALIAAAVGGYDKIVQFLVESKADMNFQSGEYGTALQAAAAGGHEKIVQFLVESKADVNVQGGEYGIALIAAAVRGYDKIVQLLVQSNVNVSVRGEFSDKKRETIAGGKFHTAMVGQEDKVLVQLLKADINDYIYGDIFKGFCQPAFSFYTINEIDQVLGKWLLATLHEDNTLPIWAKNLTGFERLSTTLFRFRLFGEWTYVKR